MCTSEHSSAGMLTPSRAAAIAALSSSKGMPECGLRSDVVVVDVTAESGLLNQANQFVTT
jgi:hypothetical protein